MRLQSLTLAGFKSFAEPTTIPFPYQLAGIVGPNGCGKSNIIDAVRWVLGESSAKNLRGESMADVIFNGSTSRKPVGQATVELIFDNRLGRLGGAYNRYQEISVKRVVARDGSADYYLNGTKCRRRDIVEIFLGTGAGSRGYAIIGQGTISKIIESRPEELRHHFEEAAGISKYRERRRETLVKMEETAENLQRLQDIRDELDKQIQKLSKQVHNATRYQQLKGEEQTCRHQLASLNWQSFVHQKEEKTLELNRLNHRQELIKDTLSSLFETQQNTQIQFETFQSEHQQKHASVFSLKQSILEINTRKEQFFKEKSRIESETLSLQQQRQQHVDQRKITQKIIEDMEGSLNNTTTLRADLDLQLEEYVQYQSDIDAEINAHFAESSKLQEDLYAKKHALSHMDQQINRGETEVNHLEKQLIKLNEDMQVMSLDEKNHEVATLEKDCQELSQIISEESVSLNVLRETLSLEKNQLQQNNQVYSKLHERLMEEKSNYASLKASHQAKLRHFSDSDSPMLWYKNIEVDESWRHLCEWVLGEGLYALITDSVQEIAGMYSTLSHETSIGYVEKKASLISSSKVRLSDKIHGVIANWPIRVEDIFLVSTFNEAEKMLVLCEPHQSVLSQDGFWLGHGWLKSIHLSKSVDDTGILALEHSIQSSAESLAMLEKERLLLQEIKAQREISIHQLTLDGSDLEQRLNGYQTEHQKKQLTLAALVERMSFFKTRLAGLKVETEETLQEKKAILIKLSVFEDEKKSLLDILNISQEKVNSAQETLNQLHQRRDAILPKVQQTKLELLNLQQKNTEFLEKQTALSKQLVYEEANISLLDTRIESLLIEVQTFEAPPEDWDALLADMASRLHRVDEQMQNLMLQLDVMKQTLTDGDIKRQSLTEELAKIHSDWMALTIDIQTLLVKEESAFSELSQENIVPLDVLTSMVIKDKEQITQKRLSVLEAISRLGAINLAALEEYDEANARQTMLLAQHQDLQEALQHLEEAIKTMDKEAKLRLKNTFDEVNLRFQQLFPTLFGGGQAMLTLTSDNVLDAGVHITAQPPGKKNSSIYLLSGGEKALTALALVFAIFQLNPSPFCMLDEVDAPLDDVNVGRFCDMVKKMSQFVQFLVISHNKVTMEMAEELIGVTMREPGVSRVVSVDVASAIEMCQT